MRQSAQQPCVDGLQDAIGVDEPVDVRNAGVPSQLDNALTATRFLHAEDL